MKKIILTIITIAVILYFGSICEAALTINGDGTWGDFTAELVYTAPKLSINVTNTSNPANGGYISAFVFNVPTNITGASLLASDTDFNLLFDIDKEKAQPYGIFDIGVTLGNNFSGGSQPWKGIDINITETFMFTFQGTDLNTLIENDFLTNSLPQGNSGTAQFVTRFQGFDNEQSDKVPGEVPQTPEPLSVITIGLGAFALFGLRKK